MIDKTALLPTILERLQTLPPDHYLDIRSYKRNRSILIVKRGENDFDVLENGFEQAAFQESQASIRKLLKVLLKKEFPRSRKVRLYTMGVYAPDAVQANKRKVI